MKAKYNFFYNHKAQAFYLSLILFMPLAFLFFKAISFQIQNLAQDKFSLAMTQFIAQTPSEQTNQQELQQTQIIEPQQEIEPLKEPLKPIKKTIKKKIKKPIQKPIEQNFKPPAQPTSQALADTPKEVQVFQYGKEDNPFLREVKMAIDKAREYPRRAIKMRMQGRVLIEFLWKEEKILSDLKILKSSGYKILDENALQTIRLASKHFPQYSNDVRITIPIEYSLR